MFYKFFAPVYFYEKVNNKEIDKELLRRLNYGYFKTLVNESQFKRLQVTFVDYLNTFFDDLPNELKCLIKDFKMEFDRDNLGSIHLSFQKHYIAENLDQLWFENKNTVKPGIFEQPRKVILLVAAVETTQLLTPEQKEQFRQYYIDRCNSAWSKYFEKNHFDSFIKLINFADDTQECGSRTDKFNAKFYVKINKIKRKKLSKLNVPWNVESLGLTTESGWEPGTLNEYAPIGREFD